MIDTKALRRLDKDELLALVGLETKRDATDWLVPTLTAFGMGVAVGVGVGMLLGARSGAPGAASLRSGQREGPGRSQAGGTGAPERVSGSR